MRIDPDVCIACEACIPYCPVEAISVDDAKGVEVIDQDNCVDCWVCLNSKVCPVDCIILEPQPYPRNLRLTFSNPRTGHKATGIAGRGTEEMKTNDVTGRFKKGWIGLGLEFGRPGVSSSFRDLEKMSMALAKHGVLFEEKNPVTFLMKDIKTGKLKDEVLGERVLSGIIECLFPIEKLEAVLATMRKVSKEIDTVFSVDCICKADPDGSYPVKKILQKVGITPYINGKQNVGLGRPLAKEE